jgi:conjugal transfer pilin signal peptidase TrbI
MAKKVMWWFCGGILAIGLCLLAIRPWVRFDVNLTHSLPGHVYAILLTQPAKLQLGETVAFSWAGGATYPAGVTFIKKVEGIPGESIRVVGRQVYVGQRLIGTAKSRSKAGVPLTPIATGPIPRDHYFLATPHPDSLDSRYAITGTIALTTILGRAYEVF